MNSAMSSAITVAELAKVAGTAKAPLVIDVRREQAFQSDGCLIAGAIRRAPESVQHWRGGLPAGRPVVVYCVHGHEVSQGVASALRSAGTDASYLAGGLAAWAERNLPLRRKREMEGENPSRWVTRERPKIDRIACPWLIRRFIDPRRRVPLRAGGPACRRSPRTGVIPYDIAGVEFSTTASVARSTPS